MYLIFLKIKNQFIKLQKSEIINMGLELGVDYSITSTCYDPDEYGLHCGICDSCVLRLKGFSELGIEDPAEYQP